MPTNWKQLYAIKEKNKQRILKVCPTVDDESGIYILTRYENGQQFAYIGQAKSLLSRLADHLSGYQWIDLSIKNHGLFDAVSNFNGWMIDYIHVPQNQLDEAERAYIAKYKASGYEMRNITSGGQGAGKVDINERRPAKGYRDGLAQGYKNAQKEIANLFEKHLDFVPKKNPPTKLQEKAIKKFKEFLEWKNEKSM